MSKLILCLLMGGAAFAGAIGTQFVSLVQAGSAQARSPGQSPGDVADPASPVVIELFTSQGCASCPPADLLARRLAKDQSLLVITRPVTYWDRLGWKDTLAREANSRLQRDYAAKGNAGAGVYTPQIVVNGGDSAVGSREHDIRSLVRRADRSGPRISISRASSGQLMVRISGKSDYMASVSLIALSSSEAVRIGGGENGGRTLHFTNVVREERVLGSWRGRQETFAVPPAYLKVSGADRYAIKVQQPGAGRIVAAKLLDI